MLRQLMNAHRGPLDRPVVVVHDQRSGSRWQDFQALEELDNRSLVVGIQIDEVSLAGLCLARMRHNGFPNRGEFPVVKMIRARTDIPQALREKELISREE